MNDLLTKKKEDRLVALDVFRGMTIALMILVNTPGSWSNVYPYLLHAKWDGLLPADLVFPFFLFIIGVSMSFSFSKYGTRMDAPLRKKIIKRVVVLFLIGVALNGFPFYTTALAEWRIMGVLQRIALSYGLAAIICVKMPNRSLWKVGVVMLVGYWAVLVLFGGDSPLSLDGNIATTIDVFILGADHLYQGFGIPFDPEGLLVTLPAAVSVIAGYLVGVKIKESKDKNLLVKNLLIIGVVATAVGLVLGLFYPINKPLWSGSYVVVTSGFACIFLGLLIEITDIRASEKWAKPFLVFGVNPMILYVVSIVLVKGMLYLIFWESETTTVNLYGWLYQNVFVLLSLGNLEFASLLFALSTVSFCWLIGFVLYRKNIIIKI